MIFLLAEVLHFIFKNVMIKATKKAVTVWKWTAIRFQTSKRYKLLPKYRMTVTTNSSTH